MKKSLLAASYFIVFYQFLCIAYSVVPGVKTVSNEVDTFISTVIEKKSPNSLFDKNYCSSRELALDNQQNILQSTKDLVILSTPVARIGIIGSTIFCPGDSVTLVAELIDIDNKYTWSQGSEGTSITVKDAGIYILSVTSPSDEVDRDTVQISHYPTPDVEIVSDGPLLVCSGEKISLSTDKPYSSYKWSSGSTRREDTAFAPGKYIVEVSDENGCRGADTVEVIWADKPGADIETSGPIEFCEGDSVVLTGKPDDAAFWIWSYKGNPIKSKSITAKEPGMYYLIVGNTTGCLDTAFVKVIVHDVTEIKIEPSRPVLCEDSDVTLVLKGLSTSCSIQWSNGETDEEIVVNKIGLYSVTVTNEVGCSSYDSVFIDSFKPNVKGLSDFYVPDTACVGTEVVRRIPFQNLSNTAIKACILKGASDDSTFKYIIDGSDSYDLDINESAYLTVVFQPNDVIEYKDTVIFRITEPCLYEVPVDLSGAGKAVTKIFFPDTTANLKNFKFRLPLYMKLVCGTNVPSENIFNITASISNGVYRIDSISNYTITDNSIHDLKNTISFTGKRSIKNRDIIELTGILGSPLFGRTSTSPIKIENFDWDNELIYPIWDDGSLEVNQICQDALSHIKRIDALHVNAFPNPAFEDTFLNITGNFTGRVMISIYTIFGDNIYNTSIEKKDYSDVKINLDLKGLTSGMYSVRVNTTAEMVMLPLIINK